MPPIKEIGKGKFEVRANKRNPKTGKLISRLKSKGITTRAQAKRVEAELLGIVNAMAREAVIPTWKTVAYGNREARLNMGLSIATVENGFVCIKAHTFEDWGERPIDSITTTEIRQLIEAKVGHRTTSQKKNMLKFIKSVFNHAVEEGVIPRNPTPKMHFRHNDKLKKVLTESQAGVFLNKAKELDWKWYPHWAMALYTGMRSGELFALTWDKVNLETRQILVDSSWNSKDGFKSTKSGDDRIIEIAPNLVHVLKELKLSSPDSTFVLPRMEEWRKGRQAEELRKFLKGIKLPEIRFHDLRASWATILLSKGVEPIRIMKAGGWKDLKTMMIYVRKAGVDIKGMMDKMDLHDPSRSTATVISFPSSE